MKKFTFLLIALIAMVTTAVAETVVDGVYELKNQGTGGSRGYFVYSSDHEGKIKVAESELGGYTSDTYCFQDRKAEGVNSYWYLVTSSRTNKRYIFSLQDGTFISANRETPALSTTPLPVEIEGSVQNSGKGYYQVKAVISNSARYLSNSIGWKLSGDQVRWDTNVNDDASPVEFIKADVAVDKDILANAIKAIKVYENYEVTEITDFSNEFAYTFITARGWMGAVNESNNVISTAKTSVTDTDKNINNPNFQWVVYKSSNDNYYLYNIGKKMFMGKQTVNNASVPFVSIPNCFITFKKSSSGDYPIMFSTDNSGVVNHSRDYGEGLINWTGGWNTLNDEGSNHKVAVVDVVDEATLSDIKEYVEYHELYKTDVEIKQNELKTYLDGVKSLYYREDKWIVTNGENLEQYSQPVGADDFVDAFEHAYELTEKSYLDAEERKELDIQKGRIEGLVAGFFYTNGYYRLSYDFGDAGIKYIQGVRSGVSGKDNSLLMTGDTGAKSLFYYGSEKLLSYTAGQYVKEDDNNRGLQGVGGEGGNVTFTSANGCTKIQVTSYMHANSSGTTYFVDHCNTDLGHAAHNFVVEFVNNLPVTISSAGYASFYAPVALKIPSGVEAYYISGINERNNAAMELIVDVIPANTGVILKGTEGDYNFKVVKNVEAISGNLLAGTVAATKVESDDYVLGIMDDGKVGLCQTKEYMDKEYFINASHKAYFPLSAIPAGASLSAGFTFDFSGTTGIDEVKSEAANTVVEGIFDLMGRRVENPTRGIYIVNGKRVFIK